ncbi:hypothetical protein VPHD479_0362 [Vibrio phage D479]
MINKRVSIEKMKRIRDMPDSQTFMKLSVNGFISNEFLGVESFSRVRIRVIHGDFMYETKEETMYATIAGKYQSIGTRIVCDRTWHGSGKYLELNMKNWINLDEVIDRAGFRVSKKHRVRLAHDLSDPFAD